MRLVWRFSRNKRLVSGVLLFLLSLIFIWALFGSTAVDQSLDENDVIYDDARHAHFFVVDHAKPYQRAVEDPVEFIPNRKRTLKTYYGVIQVKDLSFVPVNPLKKSQSLISRLPDFDRPIVDEGLGLRSQGGRGGLAPLMPRPSASSNASKLYSLLQQLQKKRSESKGASRDNKESAGRGQFLNSKKMLALQAQMQARESQSIKDSIQDIQGVKESKSLTRCKKQMCTDFLTSYDLSHYRSCMKKAKIHYNKELPDSKCNFMNGTTRDAVALVSHPGSGHLWVRRVLQLSTGVCTGGIECDVKLRRSGFPGENLRSGVVLVVNTHQTQPMWTRVQDDEPIRFNQSIVAPAFGSAILLIRDPFNAIADLWHQVNGKGMASDNQWSDFVLEQAKKWQQIIQSWIIDDLNHPVLVVKYEDLRLNAVAELKKVLDFLQTPYNTFIIEELALNKFQEKKPSMTYTTEQINYMYSMIKGTIETLAASKMDSEFLSSYLKSSLV